MNAHARRRDEEAGGRQQTRKGHPLPEKLV